MDALLADKREIFATTKEDLEHGIAGQQACHAYFTVQEFEHHHILSRICFIRVTTGITPSGVFFPL